MGYILLPMIKKTNDRYRYRTFLFILSLLAAPVLFAQKGTITGKVIDSRNGEALIGVTVFIEGTTNGTSSDLDGNFIIPGLKSGIYSVQASYIGYNLYKKEGLVIENGKETEMEIELAPEDLKLDEVEVVAKANRESENMLLLDQKRKLLAVQAVGAKEMSRKGAGNAESAVAQVSGISKQEGVKNVFVRGLGDRYNATFLNGFPIPSEDPEYKNIALKFFTSDVIRNINVSKVFNADNNGDIGGAIIDINSKELFGEKAFGANLEGGINNEVPGKDFLRQDGTNYLGVSNTKEPTNGRFNFPNSLDPAKVNMPLNHSYGLSGGKLFRLGEQDNPLSFFLVASHGSDYSYTKEAIRNAVSNGTIYQDQTGEKSSINTNQLILANADLRLNRLHRITYNFMLLHADEQYVGEYQGLQSEKHQDSDDYMGFLRRQQSNDNLLAVNQLITEWSLAERFKLDVGAAYNTIKGLEPDRRENYLSRQEDGTYILTGSNRQKRFFSKLNESDLNLKLNLRYKLSPDLDIEKSNINVGYKGRFVDDNFKAIEYNFGAFPGRFSIDDLKLDSLYNEANYEAGKFTMYKGAENSYRVTKYINSGYVEATHQFTNSLTANAGLLASYVDMTVNYHVQHVSPGESNIKKIYYLPSLNLKYDINDKNSLRLGASKSYTLPQSKEISPYQYVNINFTSQGNPNLKPSDNYNVDLKWDYYLSPSELISVCGFYKYIVNPIGRVDQGNSAGLLTYENISPKATVAGVEVEVRKNIFNKTSPGTSRINSLSLGMNASYIYSNLELDIINTVKRSTQLEGASPFIVNSDVSYNFTSNDKNLIASLVLNYFSGRIYTLGTRGYNDIIEEGVITLTAVSSFKVSKHITLKLKAANLLNPSYCLTRKFGESNDKMKLDEYKKGVDVSVGISFEL